MQTVYAKDRHGSDNSGVSKKKIAVIFAVWTILGLSFAFRTYAWARQNNSDFPLWAFVAQTLVDFYLYALASPFIFRLGARFPLESGRLGKSIVFHLAAGFIFTALTIVLSVLAVRLLNLQVCTQCPPTMELLKIYLTSPIIVHQGLLAYWGTVAVGQGLQYYRDMQTEKLRVARLSSRLSEARLSALKMQLHPHFLFNTLNSIAALVPGDTEAELMIAKLSNFLRLTLQSAGAPMVTLKEELHFLQAYLEIEKVRFQDRLTVEFACDEDVLAAAVPNFLLQPLVENSIRHGISQRKTGGWLKILARRASGELALEIHDNGRAVEKSAALATGGVGLKNTVERLEQIYGGNYRFEIDGNREGGTTVAIRLPLEF